MYKNLRRVAFFYLLRDAGRSWWNGMDGGDNRNVESCYQQHDFPANPLSLVAGTFFVAVFSHQQMSWFVDEKVDLEDFWILLEAMKRNSLNNEIHFANRALTTSRNNQF